MAKKKKPRKDAPKLPKHIAGVKVPKALRAPGGRLLAMIEDPLVMDLAAATLSAAATAWVARLEAKRRKQDG